jgi:hypothetical protein
VFDSIADEVGNPGRAKDDPGDDEAAADVAEVIRNESQRIVANGLRNASDPDRTAIIGSASFRALLTAATTQGIGFAGMECIDLALKQTFGNITDSTAILSGAALSVLVQVLARSTGEDQPNLRRCGAWAIKNCCRGRPPPPLDLLTVTVPVLVEITKDSDTDTVADALWALAYISQCSGEYISIILDNGALPTVLQHLQSSSWNVTHPSFRCLSNILHGDAHQTAFAIEHGALAALCAELRTASHNSDILRVLGNIAGDGARQVNKLLQAGVFDFIADDVGINGSGSLLWQPEAITAEAKDIRDAGERIVANALRNASDADRTAIIRSASFRALLTAALTQHIGFAGMESINFVLNRRADIDVDELAAIVAAIVAALRHIECPTRQQIERINGWLRRFKAKPLRDVTSIQQPQRKQPPPPQR